MMNQMRHRDRRQADHFHVAVGFDQGVEFADHLGEVTGVEPSRCGAVGEEGFDEDGKLQSECQTPMFKTLKARRNQVAIIGRAQLLAVLRQVCAGREGDTPVVAEVVGGCVPGG